MTDDRNHEIGERLETVERKLDHLSASVDKRFDDAAEAVVEQRRYTEFAFDRLANEMRSGFDAIRAEMRSGFQAVDGRIDALHDEMRSGFQAVDGRIDALQDEMRGGFQAVDGRIDAIHGDIDDLRGGFNRLERKLDRFVDVQSKTNELVDRRLRALEHPGSA